jgi:lipid A 4'-phosphatase
MRRSTVAYGAALLALVLLFSLFPGIDLWVSGLFYRAGTGFPLGQIFVLRGLYTLVPFITWLVVITVPLIYLVSRWRGRTLWGIDGKAAIFLLAALALGPGLLVNTILKDHWGRARPAQLVEFGGSKNFTPALLPADQCVSNCSFPAGHPAIGFYLVSFAFLAREPRRRRRIAQAALGAGAAFGLARIAQGGHFLSDVVFSGWLVCGTSALVYRTVERGERVLAAARRGVTTAQARPRLAAAALCALILIFFMLFIDRPIARDVQASGERWLDLFQFITQFGLGKGYLILAGILFIGMRGLAAFTIERELAARFLLTANRALFIFLVVALPGLFVDIIKPIFGRARPKLYFADGTYGFEWGALQADRWSFPSGHATTAAALCVALSLLWPRFLPEYLVAALLIAASRVMISAHYTSDVLAGALVGGLGALLIWRGFRRAGVALDGRG